MAKNDYPRARGVTPEIIRTNEFGVPDTAGVLQAAEAAVQPALETIVAMPEPVVLAAPVVVNADYLFSKLKETGNQAAITNVQHIFDYVSMMGPKATMPTDTGARNQVQLFISLRNIVEYSEDQFALAFATVLALFDEYKDGVFNERYVFRFMDSVALSAADRKCFERLLNLIKIAAPTTGRKESMKQVSFSKTLEFGYTEVGKQRIMNFFNV